MVPMEHRPVQAVVQLLVDRAGVGPAAEEEEHDEHVAVLCRADQRREMPLVALVYRALGVEQDLARAQVALERCPVQRRVAVVGLGVLVGAVVDEPEHELVAVVECGPVQR